MSETEFEMIFTVDELRLLREITIHSTKVTTAKHMHEKILGGGSYKEELDGLVYMRDQLILQTQFHDSLDQLIEDVVSASSTEAITSVSPMILDWLKRVAQHGSYRSTAPDIHSIAKRAGLELERYPEVLAGLQEALFYASKISETPVSVPMPGPNGLQ